MGGSSPTLPLTCSLNMAELTSITIRLVMRRSSRPRFPISANVCIGCDLLRQYHFGVVLIFVGFAPSRRRRPASLSSPQRPEVRTLANHLPLNKSLFNYCVFHARIRIRSFSCLWLRFRVLSNANLLRLLDRWQDTRRSHHLATHACQTAAPVASQPACLPRLDTLYHWQPDTWQCTLRSRGRVHSRVLVQLPS